MNSDVDMKTLRAFDKLLQELADDLLTTSSDEVMEEIIDEYGDPEIFYKEFQDVVTKTRNFSDAKQEVSDHRATSWHRKLKLPKLFREGLRLGALLLSRPVLGGCAVTASMALFFSQAKISEFKRIAVSPDQYAYLASIDLGEDDYKAAFAAINGALVLDASNAKFQNIGGVVEALYSENGTVALEYFDRAIEADPTQSNALNNKGYVLHELGDYDLALQSLNKSIEVTPSAMAFWNRSAVWIAKRQDGEAIRDLEAATKRDPGFSVAFETLASLYMKRNEPRKAISAYDALINLDEGDTISFHKTRGDIYEQIGDFKSAIEDFEEVKRFVSYDDQIIALLKQLQNLKESKEKDKDELIVAKKAELSARRKFLEEESILPSPDRNPSGPREEQTPHISSTVDPRNGERPREAPTATPASAPLPPLPPLEPEHHRRSSDRMLIYPSINHFCDGVTLNLGRCGNLPRDIKD